MKIINWVFLIFLLFPHQVFAQSAHWELIQGEGYSLCDELLAELSKYDLSSQENIEKASRCSRTIVENYSGFSALAWSEPVDAKAYRGLLVEINKLSAYGGSYYFNGVLPPDKPQLDIKRADAQAIRIADDTIDGGKAQVQFLRLPLPYPMSYWFNDNHETAGDLNLVRVSFPDDDMDCSGYPKAREQQGFIKLVNQDLTAPDPRLNPIKSYYPSFYRYDTISYIYRYKNMLHLIHENSGVIEITPQDQSTDDDSIQFCNIILTK